MVKESTSKGIVKKGKNPNAPKRPMSAYFLWLNENRNRFKKPGMKASDVAKAAGAEWSTLTDQDKSKWEKLADAEKARYAKEAAEFRGDKI